ncbi:MAG: DUF885 domain-containing protein, partial [Acidobacteriaceae bacterium]|nr:DUF885 domain-containing protein [Acidobacteriaceae bacterium]
MKFMKLPLLLLAGASVMSAQSSLDSLVDRYFDDYFRLYPSAATAAGFHHPFDSQLEDYSKKGFDRRIQLAHRYLPHFENQPASDDRDFIVSRLRAGLLSLETIRDYVRDPDIYSSGVTSSIFDLISRKFAPPEERLRSVVARERQIPQVLAHARENLTNPPRIYTEIAIEQLPGNESFFAKDVPAAFTEVKDRTLLDAFAKSNSATIDVLKQYQRWLESDLLTRSHGDFRIGSENFRKKLLFDEMVDIPLDRILEIGYADLRKNQNWLKQVCAKIDPAKTPQQIADRIGKDHPEPSRLLESFRNTFNGLIGFTDAHHIITIPSDVRPILEETPPFMRALTTASMDTPGPYENVATEAYFNVTLPEKNWSREETEEFMTAFNRGTIVSTAIHEAYPGHYVQFLWFHRLQSKKRKLLHCNTNVEGWAHYTEQMMLDEGYGDGDLQLRAGQLLDALLRDCRYIVGLEMHSGKMTYDQGIEFFMREGFMTRAYAERETKRGTSDPTYLYYTLGKLQIMKLRED